AGWTEHDRVARGLPVERVRRGIGVVIGLDLDDDAADALEQQRRADEIGRHLVHAAGKEFSAEQGCHWGYRLRGRPCLAHGLGNAPYKRSLRCEYSLPAPRAPSDGGWYRSFSRRAMRSPARLARARPAKSCSEQGSRLPYWTYSTRRR